MRVLVAMSGGVDSSVAAALLAEAGHEVVGATLKLWGGPSDSGCCSVGDVEDARGVARQLGLAHHVFNMTDRFETAVVAPYVAEHAAGRTPNPCVECNRHLKFGALLDRARRLGFDAVATGHHARVVDRGGRRELRRGTDRAKDQSYVLSMLGQDQLAEVLLPVGELTKEEVRHRARTLGLRTAAKPDSYEVCFIASDRGRQGFLEPRIGLHPAALVDPDGAVVGAVPAVELVTVGQRKGLGGDGRRRFALQVDVAARRVVVGTEAQAVADEVTVATPTWVDAPPPAGGLVLAQTSAHGAAWPARYGPGGVVQFDGPRRLVAPGQTVAFYDPDDPDRLLGGAVAAARAA